MKEGPIQVLPADNDIDDCLLFGKALSELSLHNGYIEADGRTGEGARFDIYLPVN